MSHRYGDVPLRCRAVATAVIAGKGPDARLLILRRAGPVAAGAWGLVTGSVEPGETAAQAARRETQEETGLMVQRLFTSGLTETFYFAPDNVIDLMPVFVGFVAAPVSVALDSGSDAFQWCTPEEAISRMHFAGQRRAIADIWHDFVEQEPNAFREVP